MRQTSLRQGRQRFIAPQLAETARRDRTPKHGRRASNFSRDIGCEKSVSSKRDCTVNCASLFALKTCFTLLASFSNFFSERTDLTMPSAFFGYLALLVWGPMLPKEIEQNHETHRATPTRLFWP